MREIKFRGKPIEDYGETEWFYGSAIMNYEDKLAYIESSGNGIIPVEWESVGQYTEIKDRNGIEIYEGDVVSRHDGGIHFSEEPHSEHVVKRSKFGWSPFVIGIGKSRCVYGEIFDFIVIGNMHDQKNLLKGVSRDEEY